MTFNIMCDFCHKSEQDRYSKRLPALKEIIAHHESDLIAIQELRTGSQAKELFSKLKNHEIYYTDSFIMSYADPVIAFNKKRFELLDKGGFWLGPGDGFSFGWKFALPRRALWVKLKEKRSQQIFYFITSHFDNRVENLANSSKKLKSFIHTIDYPVIFAADTNSKPNYEGYQTLLSAGLADTYPIAKEVQLRGKKMSESDLCYYRKGKTFPDCRVDHVFTDDKVETVVLSWLVDLTRFGEEQRFPSDHRPIVTKLKLKFAL